MLDLDIQSVMFRFITVVTQCFCTCAFNKTKLLKRKEKNVANEPNGSSQHVQLFLDFV